MSEEILFGRIRGPRPSIEKVMVSTAIGTSTSEPSGGADKQGIPFYRVYLGVTDGTLAGLGSLPDQSVASYISVFDEALETIEVGEEVDGFEAVFKYYKFMEKLNLVSYDEDVTVSFYGQPGAEYANKIRIDSDLTVEYAISSSSTARKNVPRRLLESFDEDNVFTATKSPLDVEVETSVSEMQKIIRVVDSDDELLHYPVSSDGDNLTLEAEGSMGRSSVHGTLPSSTVNNPNDDDLNNMYHNGFKEIFDVLDGSVTLYTSSPDGSGTQGGPLEILQTEEGMVRRYVIAPTKQA